MKLKFFAALLTGLFLTGCGYELPKTGEPADNANQTAVNKPANSIQQNANAAANRGNENASAKEETETGPIIFSEGSQTLAKACNGREVIVEKTTTANNINLTGECKKLTVDGVSNRVTVEKVGEIIVRGVSNKVIYGAGLDGKKPKISKTGVSTSVDSNEEIEKKKDN